MSMASMAGTGQRPGPDVKVIVPMPRSSSSAPCQEGAAVAVRAVPVGVPPAPAVAASTPLTPDRGAAGPQARRARAPLTLTRRGRVMLAAAAAIAAAALASLLWAVLAAGAGASSHHQPANAGYHGMIQVVVQPGQTLWSLASAAEPTADPRIVIQQIIDANALGGSSIHTGELLWVPRP